MELKLAIPISIMMERYADDAEADLILDFLKHLFAYLSKFCHKDSI